MSQHDAEWARPSRPCGQYEFTGSQSQKLAASEPCNARPACGANDRHRFPNRRLINKRHQRKNQHKCGNTHHYFCHTAQEHVDPAAEVAAEGTNHDADRAGQPHRHKSHCQRHRRAVHHLGQHINPVLIRAKEIQPIGMPFVFRRICRPARPLVVADGTVGILKDQRPDRPALGIFFPEILWIRAPEAILYKNCGLKPAVEITQTRGIDLPLVSAQHGLGAGNRRRKNRDADEKADKHKRRHGQRLAAVAPPRSKPKSM